MSYDFYYWRGKAKGAPAEIVSRLGRGKAIKGIEKISAKEVVTAFEKGLEEGVSVEESDLLGRGFSVSLEGAPLRMLVVHCSYDLLNHPDFLRQIESVMIVGLRCHRYNPQTNEFVENLEGDNLASHFARVKKAFDIRYPCLAPDTPSGSAIAIVSESGIEETPASQKSNATEIRNSEAEAATPEQVTKDHPYINSLGMTFVPVPGVRVLFCAHPTRKGDYRKYARENPATNKRWENVELLSGVPVSYAEDHPVVKTSWEDAKAFCEWLSRKEGRTYRLPTDCEWSWAVGIGAQEDPSASPKNKHRKINDVFPWGTQWPPSAGVCNYTDAETLERRKRCAASGFLPDTGEGYVTTSPVMSFPPNKLGLYDLAGNVWEWCEDCYEEAEGSSRVLRGGAWFYSGADLFLSSYRELGDPGGREDVQGFRIVLEL